MEFPAFNLTDCIHSGALVVVLIILLVMNDRSKFISFHIIANVGFGIGYIFFPKYAFGFQVNGELDDVAVVCCGLFGWALIAMVVVWYLTRDTRDGTVPITLMTAEVFSWSVVLLCQFYTNCAEVRTSGAKEKAPENPWTPQHVIASTLGASVLLILNLVYLLRSHDFSSYPQHNIRVNEYLRLDAGLAMLLALTCLAFPDIIFRHFWPSVKNISPVAKHVMRMTGACILNTAFVSLQAAGFLHEKDKKKQFIGRLVGILLLFMPFIQGAVMHSQFTLQQIEWALLAVLPLAINGVLGLMAEGTITTHKNKYL